MHTLVRGEKCIHCHDNMPDCIGGSFVICATAWILGLCAWCMECSHSIRSDKVVRIFCKGFISACVSV